MTWNYHDDDTTGPAQQVTLRAKDIPASQVLVTEYLIDRDHSNSYEAWKKMGSPAQPSAAQIATLEKAGQLQTAGKPVKVAVSNGALQYNIVLQKQAVALLKIDW